MSLLLQKKSIGPLLLLVLLMQSMTGYSQALPIDFESTITTSNFVDFDGGIATVIDNPQSNSDNPSAKVAQIVRNGGQPWGGSYVVLAQALDFSTLNAISMKVYTTAPVGTTVKFKLENGSGASTEKDVVTTVTGAWETLTWDFTGTSSDLTTVVFMFDFGNTGDGSPTSTFLFDDIQQVSVTPAPQVALPFDFESDITTANFVDFSGGVATVIDNPQSNGDNSSAKTAQIVRNGGEHWAGSKVILTSNLDFTTNNSISMKVFTTAPIGTIVKFKLENSAGGFAEKDVATTVTGAWETMTWDFTGTESDLNILVFMFDFGNTGDGSATSTFLFDDVQQITGSGPGGNNGTQIDLPVDFEGSTTDYTTIDFGGNASSLVPDPENASNTVIKVIRTDQAVIYAGTTIGTASGFTTDIPLTLEEPKMTVMVWSPLSGIPVKLKVEDSGNNEHTCETMTLTTVASGWELITFDFSMEAEGTAKLSFGLDNGWKYNKASIFFNFGVLGSAVGEQTYYFDDVKKISGGANGGGSDLAQIDLPVDFEGMTTDYTLTDFEGNESALITDPDDATNTIVKIIKKTDAKAWAGTSIGTSAGFAMDIPISMAESKMTIAIWSPAPGLPIRLKIENSGDNTQTCETETMTTAAGVWENLTFDFTNQVDSTATLADGLNMGWKYDLASIFFNFGVTGADAGELTFYFDNVEFGELSSSIELPEIEGLTIMSNPTIQNWNINSGTELLTNVEFYDIQGKLLKSYKPNSHNLEISSEGLAAGMYVTRLSSKTGISVVKLIKR